MCPVGVHWAVLGSWVGMGILWGGGGTPWIRAGTGRSWGCNQVGCPQGPWEGSTAQPGSQGMVKKRWTTPGKMKLPSG